ncbi:S-layer homology domain-containing protein [Alteribacillus persepolensis]|uniref:S-layer homology domain-containing protein n=1 Tax=Alteribacillus persepolensis TaxID=568899 RepID=A0A1G8GC95_9BACI|nr:S-layer homology domain-containing protein [Alteribacillus persepolensis]SDH91921.1 S-layer homology domain-containing protein [Alteribacillus persepolensis]
MANITGAGVTTGYAEDNIFRPSNNAKRAQFSVLSARVLDSDQFGNDSVAYRAVNFDVYFIDLDKEVAYYWNLTAVAEAFLLITVKRSRRKIYAVPRKQGIEELEWIVAAYPECVGGICYYL